MGMPEKQEKVCIVCKSKEVETEGLALCKSCLEKQDYEDVCIGINSSLLNRDE